MKKIFLIFLSTLFLFSQVYAFNPLVVCSGVPATTSSTAQDCDSFSGLGCEDFEGSTACEAAGTAVCRQTFDGVSGTQTWDTSTSGLDMHGDYCVKLENGAYFGDYSAFWTNRDSVYFMFKFRITDAVDVDTEGIFSIWGSGNKASVYLGSSGKYGAFAFGGTAAYSATGKISVDTSYWVRGYYTKGTGANAICKVSIWNGSSWESYIESTDGSETDQIDGFLAYNPQDGAAEDIYFDMIKFSATEFTNSPDTY